jgi:hypothetical protein
MTVVACGPIVDCAADLWMSDRDDAAADKLQTTKPIRICLDDKPEQPLTALEGECSYCPGKVEMCVVVVYGEENEWS